MTDKDYKKSLGTVTEEVGLLRIVWRVSMLRYALGTHLSTRNRA